MKREKEIRQPQYHDYMAPDSIDPKKYAYKSPGYMVMDLVTGESMHVVYKPAYFSRVFRKGGASARAGDIVRIDGC